MYIQLKVHAHHRLPCHRHAIYIYSHLHIYIHTCSHFGSSKMGSSCTCSRQAATELPVIGRHYLTPLPLDWKYIWPKLTSYPVPTPLPAVRLEDPENYPFQSRVYEFGEYDRRRGLRDNVYPEYCCLCEDRMDYYVPWGVCGECTGKVWRALLDQFSEAAWTIMDFLEPVPAYQCPECDPDWLGWYCYNCGHTCTGYKNQFAKADAWFLQLYQNLAEPMPTEEQEEVRDMNHPLWGLSMSSDDNQKHLTHKHYLNLGNFESLWVRHKHELGEASVSRTMLWHCWNERWKMFMPFRGIGQGKHCRQPQRKRRRLWQRVSRNTLTRRRQTT